MAIHIENFHIGSFRGIHDLNVANLNHINIIAGDNNCGKTSVLEALLLLRKPDDFNNILRIARLRDFNPFINPVPLYENFVNLFPRVMPGMEISLDSICRGKQMSCRLIGEQIKIMMDPEDLAKKINPSRRYTSKSSIETGNIEADAFTGTLQYDISGHKDSIPVEFDSYSSISGREIKRSNSINMLYLSPTDHLYSNVFGSILKNDTYKEICLRILQLFDTDIIDLIYSKNDNNSRPVENIKHAKLGNMPISTYGDGIKKVLSSANAIVMSAGGVLMIDEVETAIHSKYYDDIFRFLVKASIQFDVQVFITTQSIEAIDGLLSTQDYDKQNTEDNISVITFKKDTRNHRTYSRNLAGRNVYVNREEFGFEVRV
jgi:AAA15 family ATPase/GTPase